MQLSQIAIIQIALHDRVSLCNAGDITESTMAIGSLKIEYGLARTASTSEFWLVTAMRE